MACFRKSATSAIAFAQMRRAVAIAEFLVNCPGTAHACTEFSGDISAIFARI